MEVSEVSQVFLLHFVSVHFHSLGHGEVDRLEIVAHLIDYEGVRHLMLGLEVVGDRGDKLAVLVDFAVAIDCELEIIGIRTLDSDDDQVRLEVCFVFAEI